MKTIHFIIGWGMILLVILLSCKKESDENTNLPESNSEYVILAFNDLGMHCLNPSYNELVILPPYNTVNAQVIKKGNPPQLITNGLTIEYRIKNNSFSYGKKEYSGFWDYFTELFGGDAPNHDIGISGAALSGTMSVNADHFTIEGIPLVPIDDDGYYDAYQVMELTLKNANGTILTTTETTVPTSDEINCAKCHGDGTTSTFEDILKKHDESNGTQLLANQPVLCASCHGSPVLLGTNDKGSSGHYLSEVIHSFHATKNASCYDCHPGNNTQCNRSLAHMGTSNDGNCTTCHGTMATVGLSITQGRIPWIDEPKCVTCHQNVDEVETNSILYRNAKGHGDLFCASCHGSPHAMYPSNLAKDNFQPKQLQGSKIKSIGSCGVCHHNSRGEDDGHEFAEEHGGLNPEHKTTCNICHTAVPDNKGSWPHSYQWHNSN
nr:multiheme c-type cytochrome [uncultured Carboxylicivirga sp.]